MNNWGRNPDPIHIKIWFTLIGAQKGICWWRNKESNTRLDTWHNMIGHKKKVADNWNSLHEEESTDWLQDWLPDVSGAHRCWGIFSMRGAADDMRNRTAESTYVECTCLGLLGVRWRSLCCWGPPSDLGCLNARVACFDWWKRAAAWAWAWLWLGAELGGFHEAIAWLFTHDIYIYLKFVNI